MNEAKPVPCPACGGDKFGRMYANSRTLLCETDGCRFWVDERQLNAIRARVLREAAELFVERQNELANATDSYGRARFDEIHRARFELAIAADRAERGEA